MSVLILAVVLSVIAFAFSIVLVVGVFKRKPGLVIAYFVYGVVMTAVTLVGSVSIVFMFALEESFTPRYIIPCIGGLVIYSAVLWMIWKTYKKLKTVNLYIPATANTVQIDVNKKQNEITIHYFDSESID
ncbi:hypothetical protein O0L34_g13888 [Tuta absoluta]|nr:hypothetical protein O0L34_g13888 [Tuta absoluta]